MARTIAVIQNEILNAIANDPILSQYNSTSKTAIFNLIANIIATSMAIEETNNDQFQLDVETIGKTLAPGTPAWVQAMVFLFQYNSVNTQIIQLDTTYFVPYYPNGVVTAYQIITNCSVTQGLLNQINVKVAKGSLTSPVALTTPELQALQYYLNLIKVAGVVYNAISLNADKLQFAVTVKYKGIYSSTIQASLLNAYNNYLQSLPFDGVIILVDILIALRQVVGVIDVVLNNIVARPDILPFPGGTVMVSGNDWITTEYSTRSGYIQDETESGQDFLSLLTLQAV